MARADALRAELAAVELEERLVALKSDPNTDPEELRLVKQGLRAARHEFRSLRAATPPEASGGDATARPATIKTAAGVKRPGGSR